MEAEVEKAVCIVHSESCGNEAFVYLLHSDKHHTQKDANEVLSKIQSIKSKRLQQKPGASSRLEEECKNVPDKLENFHGYHKDCYRKFTKNSERLKGDESQPPPEKKQKVQTRSCGNEWNDGVLFHQDCIFCNRETFRYVRHGGEWKKEPLSKFCKGGGKVIEDICKDRIDDERYENLLRRIHGVCLFSKEAVFHESCRVAFKNEARDSDAWRSNNEQNRDLQARIESAHHLAFLKVQEHIDRVIINERKVLKMTDLLTIYTEQLRHTEFCNDKYRSEKLKKKIMNVEKYKVQLGFTQLDVVSKFTTYLVYCKTTSIDDLIKNAYKLGTEDIVKGAALSGRSSILKRYKDSTELPWPITTDTLRTIKPIPDDVFKFLSYLINGKMVSPIDDSKIRIINSIGQDICRAVTNGRWKLPKHVSLGMTLYHMFRSKELLVMMSRYGTCENYSFIMELITAIESSLDLNESILTSRIIKNPASKSLFHSDFDNFDEYINSLHGAGSVHFTHGIMLQEIKNSDEGEQSAETVQKVPKTKRRSNDTVESEELPPCYMSTRKSPDIIITKWQSEESREAGIQSRLEIIMYYFLRILAGNPAQTLPGFSGFVSLIGEVPEKLTTIEYYPPIRKPATENATVQEALNCSERASKEAGQEIVVTTFDLGMCMKAYPIMWNSPGKYVNHIILIGTFHLIGAYLKVIGKKVNGSGFCDILIESGLMTTGSLNGVLSGKGYDRALNCHRSLCEALIRLLYSKFIEQHEGLINTIRSEVTKFMENKTKAGFNTLKENPKFRNVVVMFSEFVNGVKTSSELGSTAVFWIQYTENVMKVLSLLKAVKLNDFELYRSCLFDMCDMFFAFDSQNYARYLAFFSVYMTNIEENHPGSEELLKMGAFSVARSFVSGSRCAVDKTIEETLMKHGKSKGGMGSGSGVGMGGILNNPSAYQRWMKTTHKRTQFKQMALGFVDMIAEESGTKHRDLRTSGILHSENDVLAVKRAIENFINPFNVGDDKKLYCISSGKAVSEDIKNSILSSEETGRTAKEEFIRDRLVTKKNFFLPVEKKGLKTFASASKSVVIKTTKNKQVEYKQQSNVAFQLLVQAQMVDEKVDLVELVSYPLTPVPCSLGTSDGMLLKTEKAKGMNHLTDGHHPPHIPSAETTLVVEDGNALFHCLKDLPKNFKGICEKILDMVSSKSQVIFSTDMYKENSIKSMERKRRGEGEKLIVRGSSTKKPRDWKMFLSNDENKQQLISLLSETWRDDTLAPKIAQKPGVIIIDNENAYQILSQNGVQTLSSEVPQLRSTLEETDARVVLYAKYALDQGFKQVVVHSPDSDIFFILLKYSKVFLDGIDVIFDTGNGNKRRLINISEMSESLTQIQCDALLGLHAFTHCDTTSAFKGIGKVKPIQLLLKEKKFEEALSKLGDAWNIDESLIDSLEKYTCVLYGKKKDSDINKVRVDKLKEKCGINKLDPTKNFHMASLPPCKMALEQHIRRANYQVRIWKNAHVNAPTIPDPTDGHGWHIVDGFLEPLWVDGPIIPRRLEELLEPVLKVAEKEDETVDDEEEGLFEEIWEDLEDYFSDDDV